MGNLVTLSVAGAGVDFQMWVSEESMYVHYHSISLGAGQTEPVGKRRRGVRKRCLAMGRSIAVEGGEVGLAGGGNRNGW